MKSYVYFLTDDHGHIKIGKADDVYSRGLELQTGNPYKLRILLCVPLDNDSEAYELEHALHVKFDKSRLEGEWFEETDVLDMLEQNEVTVSHFKFTCRGIPLVRYVK